MATNLAAQELVKQKVTASTNLRFTPESGEEVPHPPHHWWMDAIFPPVVACAYSIIVQAMTCSLFPLSAPSFPHAC